MLPALVLEHESQNAPAWEVYERCSVSVLGTGLESWSFWIVFLTEEHLVSAWFNAVVKLPLDFGVTCLSDSWRRVWQCSAERNILCARLSKWNMRHYGEGDWCLSGQQRSIHCAPLEGRRDRLGHGPQTTVFQIDFCFLVKARFLLPL